MARWFRSGIAVVRSFRLPVPYYPLHAPFHTSRSSNRTGGFPASGSRRRYHAPAHGKLAVRLPRLISPSVRPGLQLFRQLLQFHLRVHFPAKHAGIADWTFTSDCSPHHLAMMQLSLVTGRGNVCPEGTCTLLIWYTFRRTRNRKRTGTAIQAGPCCRFHASSFARSDVRRPDYPTSPGV